MNAKEEGIIGQVRHALAVEPRLDAPKIRITMVDSQLLLSGVVDDANQALIAEQIARQAAPGVLVDNSLTVGGGGETTQDKDLQRLAGEAVQAAKDMMGSGAGNVGVEVRGGVAYLMGGCATLDDKASLIAAAGGVPGIARVDADRLQVAPFGTADASRLQSLALERLQAEVPDLAGAATVVVRERSARLVGRVRHQADRERAVAAVTGVPGIANVIDELVAYQDGARSGDADAVVEQAVRRALGEAGLPVAHIAVFAAKGTVALMGAVAGIEAHRLATHVAKLVPGVTQVDNQLDVTGARGIAAHEPGDRRMDIHALGDREVGKKD